MYARRISIVVYNYFRSSNNRNPVRAYTYTWKSKNPNCLGVHVYVYVPVWLGFPCLVFLERLKSDYNQTWVKDAIWVLSYVNEVRGNVPRSMVI